MSATIVEIPLKDKSLFKQDLFINGEWTAGSLGDRKEVVNPATGEVIANIAIMIALALLIGMCPLASIVATAIDDMIAMRSTQVFINAFPFSIQY
mgnify:CR=1 FL=1